MKEQATSKNTHAEGTANLGVNEVSAGTKADLRAGVDISKVHGGYFSNPEVAMQFCTIGIDTVISQLPQNVQYIDFGCGDGYLAKAVVEHLKEKGKNVSAIVADANEGYLAKASERGLQTYLGDLRERFARGQDLITMRAVNHYSDPVDQMRILRNAFHSLKEGGVLLSQVSSGSAENCELRSLIVNLPSLEKTSSKMRYHWTGIDEYMKMLNLAGFKDVKVLGYAKSNAWGPEEQWERMRGKETQEARDAQDAQKLARLEKQKQKFLKNAYTLIEIYQDEYGERLGIIENSDGTKSIEYQYPIIVARK